MTADPARAPTLRELQQWMAAQILPGARDETATPEVDGRSALLVPPERGSVLERMRVYAGGYPARLHEALEEAFPAVAHMIGEGAFADLVHRYAEAIPLGSYNLNDAGAGLPRFLGDDTLTTRLPFLPDLAQLEWQVVRAFHAHMQAALDPTVLAAWGLEEWEGAVLCFQPGVALVTSEWPIREIWEARETPIAEIDIDLRSRSDRVLVYRDGDTVRCESVDDVEAECLRALLEQHTLGSVVADLTARGGDAASVTAWFACWMARGLIRGCELAAAAAGA